MHNDQLVRDKVLDITKSFLVQAPAGSGKTSILVQRFLTALINAQQGPEEVLAITFTRKAAAEMRDRILHALQAAYDGRDAINPYEQKLFNLAAEVLRKDKQNSWHLLDNPNRLKIQTIDSLCASITQQMPILSRFGAQPQIESNPEFLYDRAVDQLLLTADQECAWQNSLLILLRHLDNDRIKIKNLFKDMLRMRDQWLPKIVGNQNKQDMRKFLQQGLEIARNEALEELIEAIPPNLDFSLLPCTEPESIEDWLEIANVLLTTDGAWRKQVTIKQGFAAPTSVTDKNAKELLKARKDAMHAMLEMLIDYEDFRQLLNVLRVLPPAQYTDQQWLIVEALIQVLPVLAAQLTIVFRDSGKVDFIEVSMAAIAALAEQNNVTDLMLALDCKIKHILVDEFQDTSHTQFKLLELLTINWDMHDGRSMFLVGDPMQSIYRFRQADVGLFLKAKQQGIGKIKFEFAQLTTNFRSTAGVIEWINNVFTNSFPTMDNMVLGSISYMSAHAKDIQQPYVDAVNCINVSTEHSSAKIIEILKHHQTNYPDQSIAILVRAKSHLLNLLPALRQANIGFQGVEIENLAQRQLIQDLSALTQAILHLDDRVAWLAILRAPWCGVSLEELSLIADNQHTIWQSLQSHTHSIRTKRFVTVMHNAIQMLGRQQIAQLVKHTWLALGGMECIQSEEEVQEADAFFALLSTYGNSRELYAPNFLAQQLGKLFLPATDTNNNVQIMTMHKAKGLEFDMVILPNLDQSTQNDTQKLLLLEAREYQEKYLLLAPIRSAEETEDSIYAYLSWCEKQRQAHEMLRLFYVAATRAKSKLYCLAEINEDVKPSGMLGKIWHVVQNEFVSSDINTKQESNRDLSLHRLPDVWFNANDAQSLQLVTDQISLTHMQPDWLRIAGIVMHRILYRITCTKTAQLQDAYLLQLPSIIRKQLRSMLVSASDQKICAEIILQAVNNMLNDEFGKNILLSQHKESYAEWSLAYPHQDDFITVVLDRVFVDANDTLWLIDYKLVQTMEDTYAATVLYKEQVNNYAKVLSSIKPGRKIIRGLYFPLQAKWQPIT